MLIKLLKPYELQNSERTLWIEPWISGIKRLHLQPNTIVIRFDNCSPMDVEAGLMPATEEDILKTLQFAERFSKLDFKPLGIWSDAIELGLAVSIGLSCWLTEDPRRAMAQAMEGHMGQYPNEWVIKLYDYCLGLSGSLIWAAEEYRATGAIITPEGKVMEVPY